MTQVQNICTFLAVCVCVEIEAQALPSSSSSTGFVAGVMIMLPTYTTLFIYALNF